MTSIMKAKLLVWNLKNKHYRKYRIADNKWFEDRFFKRPKK